MELLVGSGARVQRNDSFVGTSNYDCCIMVGRVTGRVGLSIEADVCKGRRLT